MAIKGQSDFGKLIIAEDFFGGEDIVAATAASRAFGSSLRVIGQGIAEADSGVVAVDAVSNGVVRLTTTDEAAHTCGVVTSTMLAASLNGTIVGEWRIELENLDTKTVFVGFTDDVADTALSPVTGSTTTLTLGDSDLIGFVLDAALTSDEEWHTAHNGGSATGVTVSTSLTTSVDAVAAEMDVLRVEIDPNGTGRWYINGDLVKTLAGAVSTTVKLGGVAIVQAAGAGIETADLDYMRITASRDWNA
jgi:hypothetical protein